GRRRRDVPERERVAVGAGARGGLRRDRATGARLVVDVERLAEARPEAIGDEATDEIDATAGRLWRDDAHGATRIRGLRAERRADGGEEEKNDSAARATHRAEYRTPLLPGQRWRTKKRRMPIYGVNVSR